MNKLCKNCELRNSCKKLCEEAEKYAKQDYIGINHIQYVSEEDLLSVPDQTWPNGLSTTEAIIQYYFTARWTQAEIAKKLNISRQSVSKTVRKYRAKLKKIITKTVAPRL